LQDQGTLIEQSHTYKPTLSFALKGDGKQANILMVAYDKFVHKRLEIKIIASLVITKSIQFLYDKNVGTCL